MGFAEREIQGTFWDVGMSNLQGERKEREAEEVRVNDLVRQAQEGSLEAVDELVRTFQTPIFNLAYRMVNQREDAYDLTQEIFVKVCRSIRSFRWNSRFSTWLHSLAINTCRSRRQRLLLPSHLGVTTCLQRCAHKRRAGAQDLA